MPASQRVMNARRSANAVSSHARMHGDRCLLQHDWSWSPAAAFWHGAGSLAVLRALRTSPRREEIQLKEIGSSRGIALVRKPLGRFNGTSRLGGRSRACEVKSAATQRIGEMRVHTATDARKPLLHKIASNLRRVTALERSSLRATVQRLRSKQVGRGSGRRVSQRNDRLAHAHTPLAVNAQRNICREHMPQQQVPKDDGPCSAARRAVRRCLPQQFGARSYKPVERILRLGREAVSTDDGADHNSPIRHDDVRGPGYYH